MAKKSDVGYTMYGKKTVNQKIGQSMVVDHLAHLQAHQSIGRIRKPKPTTTITDTIPEDVKKPKGFVDSLRELSEKFKCEGRVMYGKCSENSYVIHATFIVPRRSVVEKKGKKNVK